MVASAGRASRDSGAGRHEELAMQTAKWMFIAALLATCCGGAASAEGDGLTPRGDALLWSRWQGRLSLGTPVPTWRSEWGSVDSQGLKPRSLSLMGDYYFSRSLNADGGGSAFRATSGLVLGPRPALWIGPTSGLSMNSLSVERRSLGDAGGDSAALPYVGVGYSGFSNRGGWSYSADFGLAARSGGNVLGLGRVVGGAQSLDDLVRELRLTPVLQVGASYAF
jgi:hypothetical protein